MWIMYVILVRYSLILWIYIKFRNAWERTLIIDGETKCHETGRLTQRWPLGRQCPRAPCAGWCCCVPPLTGSCVTPVECCTWWLGRGRRPAAMHGSRFLPERLFSSGPFGASGLSSWPKERAETILVRVSTLTKVTTYWVVYEVYWVCGFQFLLWITED